MFRRFKSKQKRLVGIDISQPIIQILEISKLNNQICIEGYASTQLSKTSDNNPDEILESLKKLLIEINSQAQFAAIAVPDKSVLRKTIQLLDSLNESEIEELIALESDNYFSYPLKKLNIDFFLAGPSAISGMQEIKLVASNADKINQQINLLFQLGLTVKIVDIESHAIASLINRFLPEEFQNKIILILHVRFLVINFCFFCNGINIFSDEEAIEQNQEELVTSSIIKQIKMRIQHFLSSFSYDLVEQIFVVAEKAFYDKINKALKNEIKIKCQLFNPCESLTFSKNISAPDFSKKSSLFIIALGLALRLSNEF